jgi:outer membrane protein assembly factor BamB
VVSDANGAAIVLLQGGSKLTAHEPASGRQIWAYEAGCGSIPSCTFAGTTVFVPANGITALRATGAGAPEVLWTSDRLRLSTASATAFDGRIYAIAGSILKCGDAKTGEQLWQLRLQGSFSATPIVADRRVYCVSEEGLIQVVETGPTGKVIGTGSLGATILATPAVADNALYIRSDNALWKLAEANARTAAR